jgi:hypothetical protein
VVAVLIDSQVDCIQQILMTNRLGQEFDRACFHGPDRHWDIGMAADKDDRQKYVFRHETIVEIQPASPWQPDIEDETPEAARRITVEKLLNRSEQFCSQAY